MWYWVPQALSILMAQSTCGSETTVDGNLKVDQKRQGGFMELPTLPDSAGIFIEAPIRFSLSQPEFAFQLLIRKIGRLSEPLFFSLASMRRRSC